MFNRKRDLEFEERLRRLKFELMNLTTKSFSYASVISVNRELTSLYESIQKITDRLDANNIPEVCQHCNQIAKDEK
jgi:hypothetical protein